ncbi:MAG: HPF/RaiA family ribosome-associated protein [Candidatus Binatia bacterium]
MRIDVRGRHLDDTIDLQQHVERRLRFALGRFTGAVGRVTVRVEDVNGPRGGVDKRCRLVVALAPRGELIIEDEDADVQTLVDRSADRAGRAVERHLGRRRPNRYGAVT